MAKKVKSGSNYSFVSHRDEIMRQTLGNISDAAEALKLKLIDWVQYQILYGYHDPHGPDGHTEIVDTGHLFDHVDAEVKKDSQNAFTVSAGVKDTPYAVFVHNGTYKLKGRHFITDAFDLHEADIKKIVSDNIKKGFESGSGTGAVKEA